MGKKAVLTIYVCPGCHHTMSEVMYQNVKFHSCPYCGLDLGLYKRKEI